MVWGCFAASGLGRLAVMDGTMNAAVYQKILKDNVRDLKLNRTWVLQKDNDPKHTSKSTSEWLKKNKMKTLAGAREGVLCRGCCGGGGG